MSSQPDTPKNTCRASIVSACPVGPGKQPASATTLAVQWWSIERPIPYEANPRIVPERAIEKVAASLSEYGWRQPIVVDKDDVIIVGHTRLLAAKRLGLTRVPVVLVLPRFSGHLEAYLS